ncbi:DUF2206 domain-containing protein [Salinigranum rubrum]|uniref:DUF2206 domain-containing protein n=1 Tax=Salinigranum rubrum TaxID=755307 RepID=UPI0013A5BD3A|nr:DUF2206 domain-containing protein [Salinigranum rubrum]
MVVLNFSLPLLGIAEPLTLINVLWGLGGVNTCLVIILSTVSATDERNPVVTRDAFPSLKVLTIGGLLLLSAVMGTSVLLNDLGFPVSNILLLLTISSLPIVAVFVDESKTRVMIVWIASIAILLNMNLVSSYIWGWDIHRELFISNEVLRQSYWNYQYQFNINTMLTYAVLAPTLELVLGLDIVWVFKLVYPVLFSLVPVGIYYVSKGVFKDATVATLAPFVFIFYYGFFKNMPHKHYIAEIFIVTLLVVAFEERMRTTWKRPLLLLVAAGMIASHYGSAILVFGILTLVGIASVVVPFRGTRTVNYVFNLWFLSIVGIMLTYWYLQIGDGIMANYIVARGVMTAQSIPEFLTSPPTRSGAGYVTKGRSTLLWQIYKVSSILLVGAIGLGVAATSIRAAKEQLLRVRKSSDARPVPLSNISAPYAMLGVLAFGLTGSSVILTFGMGFDRIFQLMLVFLSPFFVVGVKLLIDTVAYLTSVRPGRIKSALAVSTALYLGLYLTVSSGAAFVIVGEPAPPYSINITEENQEWRVYSDSETKSLDWVDRYAGEGGPAVYNPGGHLGTREGVLLTGRFPPSEIDSLSRYGPPPGSLLLISQQHNATSSPSVESRVSRVFVSDETSLFWASS